MYLVLSAYTSSPFSLLRTTKAMQQHVITIHIPHQIIYCAYSLVAEYMLTARFKGSTVPTQDNSMEHTQKKKVLCFCTGY
jgi:hypothetical protein